MNHLLLATPGTWVWVVTIAEQALPEPEAIALKRCVIAWSSYTPDEESDDNPIFPVFGFHLEPYDIIGYPQPEGEIVTENNERVFNVNHFKLLALNKWKRRQDRKRSDAA